MDQLIASFFFDFLIDTIGYSVARLALPCLSLGRVYARPPSSLDDEFNSFGCRRDGKGRIEISSIVASSLGLVIALVALSLFGVLISTLF
jgi:hypothetical protein